MKGSGGLGVSGGCAGNEAYQKNALEAKAYKASIHNFWLELLTEGGIVFAGTFALWYGALLWFLFKAFTTAVSPYIRRLAAACSLALIGLMPAAISPSSAIYIAPIWILIGFSIAVINVHLFEKCPDAEKNP